MALEDKYNELQQKNEELNQKYKDLKCWHDHYKFELEDTAATLKEERRQYESELNLWKEKYYKILQENIELLEKLKSFMGKVS